MSTSAICQTCGVNVCYEPSRAGESVQCPACQGVLTLVAVPPVHGDFVRLDDPHPPVLPPSPAPMPPQVVGNAVVGQAQNVFIASPPVMPHRASYREKYSSSGFLLVGLAVAGAGLCFSGVGMWVMFIFGAAIMLQKSVRCGECKQDIDAQATTCPHCTLPISGTGPK